MKNSIILLLAISGFTLNSCNSQNKNNKLVEKNIPNRNIKKEKTYIGTWLYVEKKNNQYIYCSDVSKSITVSNTSIQDHTPMEDSDYKIDHIKEKGEIIYLYLDKSEHSYYTFKWISKEKGIAKWILDNYGGDIYVNKENLKEVKKENCEKDETFKGFVCEINNLSTKFNFKVSGTDFEDKENNLNPLIAKITITRMSKPSKIQEIRFEPNSWTMLSNIPCNAISYFKKEKNIKESIDNHHNFIIADFNFDGLEDFAYIWDVGGNGGALFEYFFQNKDGEFMEDKDFPLQDGLFPSEINPIKKTLTISGPVGCCKINKMTYELKENNEWKLIFSKQEDIQ